MHRYALLALSAALLLSSRAFGAESGECQRISFSGKVQPGDRFERQLGMQLSFRLVNDDDDGWHFRIGPTHPQNGEWNHYAAITPPYHFSDASFIGPGWGQSARDAAQPGSRPFWFIASRSQAAAAKTAFIQIVYPSLTDPDRETLFRFVDTLDIGQGEFEIVDADFRNETPHDPDSGAVLGLSFKVRLLLPPNFKPSAGFAVTHAPCPKKGAWRP